MKLGERLFIVLQYLLPQHFVSRVAGYIAENRTAWLKNFLITRFINHFNVDMSEAAAQSAADFSSFNDFFTRPLRAGARPVDPSGQAVVAPADGAISEAGTISNGALLQAKGQHYRLTALLGGSPELASQFDEGSFVTVYLSPRDYHRVHMPLAGTLRKTIYVPGELFSVNQTTSEHIPNLFARNERLVCIFDGEKGPFALVLVGAIVVAGIETVWCGQVTPKATSACQTDYSRAIALDKGEEMGRFRLGSTVIALFPKDTVTLDQWVEAGAATRVGARMGNW